MPRWKKRRREAAANSKDASKSKIPGEQLGYPDLIKENDDFERFYKAQAIVSESDWCQFMASLKVNLPSTFRITGCKNEAKALLRIVEDDYFAKLDGVTVDDEPFDSPICIPWYPDRLAWQFNVSRRIIRKTDAFKQFHNFLITETESGNVSRQETVSMIPPLLLDIQSHHNVLDMCAAPGSKTAQLIEMLHTSDNTVPVGVIVANDVDNKRCYMLVHQAKRLQSPCLLITNHDAGAMPNIVLSQGHHMKFDRILCDVPCSGDGTLRKNPDIWQKWNVAHCLNLHGVQARILKRGLELLCLGGRIVYSTCSLCPYENESVIHHVLSLCKGSVELVDVGDRLPGLRSVPGLTHWKMMNRELVEFTKPEDIPEKNRSLIKSYMFPPSPEDAEKYKLQRCLRILPHLQNTGGFFIAVIEKVSLLPWEAASTGNAESNPESEVTIGEENSSKNGTLEENVTCENKGRNMDKCNESPPKKRQRNMTYNEDPFFYFEEDDLLWPDIRTAYNIDPVFDHTLLLTRCNKGKRKTIYFTSETVKNIVTNNAEKLKIINTGIKLFSRCDTKKWSPTEFRVTQQGLVTILPYLKDRVVKITRDDVVKLLTCTQGLNLSQMSEMSQEQLRKYVNGSVVLVFEDEVVSGVDKLIIPLCAWKGVASLRAYVPRSDKLHFLRLCGENTFQFEKNILQPTVDDAAVENDSGEDATISNVSEEQ